MCFGDVLPLFLLHCMALFPRELSEKILLFLGPRFEKIFGCELLFFGCLCPVDIFWWTFLPMFFASLRGVLSPENCLIKIVLFPGPRFGKIFGSELLVFWCFVLSRSFLVLFCLCFCFIGWRCSPESCLKNSPILRSSFFEKIFGSELWVLEFVSGRWFWCCFASVLASLCGFVLPKAV